MMVPTLVPSMQRIGQSPFRAGVIMRYTFALVTALVCTVASTGSAQPESSFGRFVGRTILEWLEDGRRMVVVEDLLYVAPDSTRWLAAAGDTVNGASIPRPLWSIVGSPYTGKYRNASIIHDVACSEQARSWQAVHRAFYNAMRASGVGMVRGKTMYAAVYFAGPRWGRDTLTRTMQADEDFMRMRQYIEERPDVSLDQIEELTPAVLLQLHPVIRPEMQRPPSDDGGVPGA